MGRKINPIGFRLAVCRDWKSRWFAKGANFTEMVRKDVLARNLIEKKYAQAGISSVSIERTMYNVRVRVFTARPGMLIGKKGEGIEKLRNELRKIFDVEELYVDVKEVAQPEANAKLIALSIASQLERRIMYRRAMRRALSGAMRLGIDGVKIMCAGRLNGIEIARTEWYREGRVPLHTLKNEIDYGVAEAKTAMGIVGIKVWISRGAKYSQEKKSKYALQLDENGVEIVTDDIAHEGGVDGNNNDAIEMVGQDMGSDNNKLSAVAETIVEAKGKADEAKDEKTSPKKPLAKKPAVKKAIAS